jgi:hypothetical protein
MIKRPKTGFFQKKWQNKYVILDKMSHTMSIFSSKPPDDIDVDLEFDPDEVEDKEQEVKVEEIINLSDIDQINYIRNKNKGLTFEIQFYKRSLEELEKQLLVYTLAASSQKQARKWVKRLIANALYHKSANLSIKRNSHKSIGLDKKSLVEEIQNFRKSSVTRGGRKSDADRNSKKLELTPPAETASRSKSTGLPMVVIPLEKIPLSEDQLLWNSMMKPISPSSLIRKSDTSPPSPSSLGGRHSRRDIIFSKDSEALMQLIESASSSGASTPRRRSRKSSTDIGKNPKIQVVISPFKKSIWDLLLLYFKRHKIKVSDIDSNLRERTIKAIHHLCNEQKSGNFSFLNMAKKRSSFFEETIKSIEEFSEQESFTAESVPPGLLIDRDVSFEDFEIVFSVSERAEKISNKNLNIEYLYFWIHEMKKTENHKGIVRHLKNCSIVYDQKQIAGLKIGKAWNDSFPVFKGSDMISWFSSRIDSLSPDEFQIIFQKATDQKFIGKVLTDDDTISLHDNFSKDHFYFFWQEIIGEDPKNSKRSVEKLQKIAAEESDINAEEEELSFSLSHNLKTESEDDLFPSYQITEIISSSDFLNFFCCLPTDGALLTCILQQMFSTSRMSLSKISKNLLFNSTFSNRKLAC